MVIILLMDAGDIEASLFFSNSTAPVVMSMRYACLARVSIAKPERGKKTTGRRARKTATRRTPNRRRFGSLASILRPRIIFPIVSCVQLVAPEYDNGKVENFKKSRD